jgi:hypothetical protein
VTGRSAGVERRADGAQRQPSLRCSRLTVVRRCAAAVAALLASGIVFAQRTVPDPDFDASVPKPSYTREHPRVVMDEAHYNYHTAQGRYKPLADLLRNDGYDIRIGKGRFDSAGLHSVRVLIVANALGGEAVPDQTKPAFSAQECDTVGEWVRRGGALLLIADHAPFGHAAHDLAIRFGVEMGAGFAFDPQNSEGDPTILVFSRANGLLGDHPVTRGRDESERVRRVVAFTGQSLTIPFGATALMKFAPSAYEAAAAAATRSALADAPTSLDGNAHTEPIGGRAQAVAMSFGKGRVIVAGEAAMFSAQRLTWDRPGRPDVRFGMNAAGNDDRQFALNALHWLSGAIK